MDLSTGEKWAKLMEVLFIPVASFAPLERKPTRHQEVDDQGQIHTSHAGPSQLGCR